MSCQIITIGFDGPNRVGKGTQCRRLQEFLALHHIPSLIIRGDGSRSGLGHHPGDPESLWWQDVNRWLRSPKASLHDWDRTSARLARELIVWRDRILPYCAKKSGCRLVVLIIDRSLLSRTMTLRARHEPNITNNLYPEDAFEGRKAISAECVCPNILFNLIAPKNELLARLTPNDPKYEFRRELIENTADWFADAAQLLPAHIRARIVTIDASKPADQVSKRILSELRDCFHPLRHLIPSCEQTTE